MVDPARGPLDSIDILVVYDLREPPSDAAMESIARFYERGGNMLVLGDYRRGESMGPLAEMLGVGFSGGMLVDGGADGSVGPVVELRFAPGADVWPACAKLARYGYGVSSNQAVALDPSAAIERGFDVVPVLRSRAGAWLEYETVDLVDGTIECNPAAGERQDEYTVVAAVSRMVGGKEQRIVVAGDADIIANGELTAQRAGMNAQNYAVINGAFRWLSGDRYPVDVGRPEMTDNRILLPVGSRGYVKWFFMGVVPAALLAAGMAIIIRRQRK
jgi:ABC-2 type transport system permease protein